MSDHPADLWLKQLRADKVTPNDPLYLIVVFDDENNGPEMFPAYSEDQEADAIYAACRQAMDGDPEAFRRMVESVRVDPDEPWERWHADALMDRVNKWVIGRGDQVLDLYHTAMADHIADQWRDGSLEGERLEKWKKELERCWVHTELPDEEE